MTSSSFASGKMILSGEYAVVFGYPGIAVPTPFGVGVTWEDSGASPMTIIEKGLIGDEAYARKIVNLCIEKGSPSTGTITINNQIFVGRGVGSSTALVIAICRCLLGEDSKDDALEIENTVNPGNSGLDFAVIWANHPVSFIKGKTPEPVTLNLNFLKHMTLMDTGKPGETTAELVAWMTLRQAQGDKSVLHALETIGKCTGRLLAGEDLKTVMRDHHRAQVSLGVVTKAAQDLISEIEKIGGSAKVLGAGARTGDGGMVLALAHETKILERICAQHNYEFMTSAKDPMSEKM